jgi:crossover junction endodeoxyribonuclease RuvC
MTSPQLILAVDPGYERLGLAVIRRTEKGEELVASLCARTPKELPLSERIGLLAKEVAALIEEHRPDALAMERIYFSKSRSTALGVAEVRGMLETLASQHQLPVFQYSPQEVKLAITGYGASDKKAIASMLPALISMPPGARLDDELDAIAVGITCLASTRYPHR